MLQFKTFSAWITIDGKEIKQYAPELSADGTTAICWIASEAGKEFMVHWKDSASIRDKLTAGSVELDGFFTGRSTIRPGEAGHGDTVKRDHISISDTVTRPYMFSQLEFTDDDSLLDSPATQNLGEIKLRIWAAEFKRRAKPKDLTDIQLPSNEKIHERSKKATTHHVKFGDEQLRASVGQSFHKTVLIGKAPIITFKFKYRPLDILQANGIAPRTLKRRAPSSPALEAVKHETVDDEAESEKIKALEAQFLLVQTQMQSQMQTLQSSIQNLRAKESTSKPSPRKKVKLEARSQGKFVPGEIIDLT